jgi:hypothetical protein
MQGIVPASAPWLALSLVATPVRGDLYVLGLFPIDPNGGGGRQEHAEHFRLAVRASSRVRLNCARMLLMADRGRALYCTLY